MYKPKNFSELMILNGLYRPGIYDSGAIDVIFMDRCGSKFTTQNKEYKLPDDPIVRRLLKETHGCIVYQDQLIGIINAFSNLSIADSDILRDAIGHKKADVIKKLKPRFISGTIENGYDEEFGENLFAQLEYFADYGWNKAHAAAYSTLSYYTAFFKANYPLHFYAELLTIEQKNSKFYPLLVAECKWRGIKIGNPHINKVGTGFKVVGNGIMAGLSSIRGVGDKASRFVIEEREKNGLFESQEDFRSRIPKTTINTPIYEQMINVGAFNGL